MQASSLPDEQTLVRLVVAKRQSTVARFSQVSADGFEPANHLRWTLAALVRCALFFFSFDTGSCRRVKAGRRLELGGKTSGRPSRRP